MATKKEELSRWRNLTKGILIQHQNSINNLLMNLPNDCKSLSNDEKEIILKIKECYRDLLSTWSYRSKELLSKVSN